MKQKNLLCLTGIVLLALAVRLPRFLAAQVVLTEGTTYATIARNLAAGRGYVGILGVRDFFVPPLYPLLISGLIRLGMDALWAGRLLSLILGALLPLPVYWLTRELSGRRAAGLFAALFMAGHPLLIVYAARVWSETTYSFLVWCGLCCGWAALSGGKWTAAAMAGLCFGTAYLTRHEGAVYLVIFVALLIADCGLRIAESEIRNQQSEITAPLRQIVVALAVFALLAVPYVVWLSGQAGRFVWETKSVPNFVTTQRMAAGLDYVEAAYGLTAEGEPAGPFLFRNELLRQPPTEGGLSLAVRLGGMANGLREEARLLLTEIASPLALLLALFG
ncbi:MAG: glycosyltransferase family 39 protein, partial [Chloroflexi bacterium]|nr:glycosyltransferase family 39 protein [Chloroflexota bacterium]